MSDLISRKELIEKIEKNCYPIRYDRCSEENGMTVTGIMQAINEQPTAFDLESVIEQLQTELSLADKEKERCARENPLQFDEAKGYSHGMAVSLEILKSAANATNGKNGGRGDGRIARV